MALSNSVTAAPAKREEPVIVKLKTTVHNVVTNTKVVEGSVSTHTNTVVNTDTTTTTRYTATVTSTVFGTPITYTTVAPTPIDTAQIKVPAPTEEPETEPETTTQTTKASPTPAPAPETTKATTSTEINDAKGTDGPNITDAANIPTSTDSWLIDNINTSTADGVCHVNYDYYGDDDVETVTSTRTVTATVTRS